MLNDGFEGLYRTLINENSEVIRLVARCADGFKLTIEKQGVKNGVPYTVKRLRSRYQQVIALRCASPDFAPPKKAQAGKGSAQDYALLVSAEIAEDAIPMPVLTVESLGADCLMSKNGKKLECPNPQDAEQKARLLTSASPGIKYTLENSDKSTLIRLLPGHVTQPFLYESGMKIVALGGAYTREWPISFGGSLVATLLNGLGIALASILGLLLLTALIVIGVSAPSVVGTPVLGHSDVGSILIFLTQFLAFSSVLRGSSKLESLVTPFKWVTLFWPAPPFLAKFFRAAAAGARSASDSGAGSGMGAETGTGASSNGSHFSAAYGMHWFGSSTHLGDVNAIENAVGCVYFSLLLLALITAYHLAVIFRHMLLRSQFTFPHHLTFGSWESRALHLLTFPLCVASGVLLTHPAGTLRHTLLGSSTIAALALWLGLALNAVRAQVTSGRVVWLWNVSARASGISHLENTLHGLSSSQAGRWADAISDQLITQPSNKSLFTAIFPEQWVTTVGDILPLSLSANASSSSSYNKSHTLSHTKEMKKHAHEKAGYPLCSTPQFVSLVRCRSPPSLVCRAGDAAVGLLRTKWLDLLFTYTAITKLCSAQGEENFSVPLIVKTSQLSGPLTDGVNGFFYDGTRAPFARIGDTLVRLLFGAALGVGLTLPVGSGYKTGAFSVAACLALAFNLYLTGTRPYTRKIESTFSQLLYTLLALVSLSLAILTRKPQTATFDVFTVLLLAVAGVLVLYALVVITASLSALCCPPMEETRFLQRLANAVVTVHDHSSPSDKLDSHRIRGCNGSAGEQGWAVQVPAYSKYSLKQLQTKNPNGTRIVLAKVGSLDELQIDFTASEIKRSFKTGTLPING